MYSEIIEDDGMYTPSKKRDNNDDKVSLINKDSFRNSNDSISSSSSSSSSNNEDDHNVPINPSVELEFEQYINNHRGKNVHRRNVKADELRSVLESTRMDDEFIKSSSKKSRKFYERQNELIESILEPIELLDHDKEEEEDFKVKVAITGSLCVNCLLFCLQISAAFVTGSRALIATSVDAFMDLLSGFILFMTDRYRKKKNFILYPTGKSRMEPIGIIIFASLMATVSLNLLYEGVSKLVSRPEDPEITLSTKILMYSLVGLAILIKVAMFLYCRRLTHSSSSMILATDHRNDIVVNTFGVGMAILGQNWVWWLDPSGAIVVALIILRSWTSEAYEQIQLLVGKSASPEFLQKLTFIALTHHPEVLKVDTCRAFHVGNNLYVEVDIVLPPSMPLVQTHDIGESLQEKLESLSDVDRAFVHVDYEYKHKPEHKRVH
ncbi:hypothetical protein ACTFIZ_001370 [Dictyostelium cf. discoideum]